MSQDEGPDNSTNQDAKGKVSEPVKKVSNSVKKVSETVKDLSEATERAVEYVKSLRSHNEELKVSLAHEKTLNLLSWVALAAAMAGLIGVIVNIGGSVPYVKRAEIRDSMLTAITNPEPAVLLGAPVT